MFDRRQLKLHIYIVILSLSKYRNIDISLIFFGIFTRYLPSGWRPL